MSERFDPDVVAKYERETWARCAENYADTFAGITRQTVPLLVEAAVEAHHDLHELPHGPLFGVIERGVYEPMLADADLADCKLAVHEVTWRTDSLDPVLRGFWDYGNMAALPAEVQGRIEETTRKNARLYQQVDGYSFPHSVLLGSARKA